MILRSKGLLLKIIGKLNATIKPIPATMYPIFLYKYPNIDISSVMLFCCSQIGVYIMRKLLRNLYLIQLN